MKKLIIMIMVLAFSVVFSGCSVQEAPVVDENEVADENNAQEPEDPTERGEPHVPDKTEVEPTPPEEGIVQMLGKDGFDPLELSISVGDTVYFVNTGDKGDTLVFRKQGVVAMDNTDKIEPGATYSKTFDEAGVYEYWAVGFGPVGAKITVE